MRDPVALEGQIVSEKQAIIDGKTEVELWLDKLNAAKAEEKDWRESAKIASEVYEAGKDQKSHFNIYHANIETMIPALYNSTPIPDVRRRYDSPSIDQTQFAGMQPEQAQQAMQQAQMQMMQRDKLFSDVAEATERGLIFSVDQFPFDDVMEDMVRDAAVTGRGVVRIRYEPRQEGNKLIQTVRSELVTWNRFIRGPGISWHDVPFVAFEHDLTREQVLRLADDPASVAKITFSAARDDGTDHGAESEREQKHKGILRTIKVYEIWDKTNLQVLFISPEYKEKPITREQDPLQLTEFFPVPRPAQFVRRLASMVPVCPYDVYKPLIDEIDAISRRIAQLIKQLKVKGIYDPRMAPDFEMLQDAEDGKYVAASASEDFLKGAAPKLENAVVHWPIEQIVNVIQALYQEREAIKQTIYEVMGIADILRGQVDPREKATQSQLKADSGNRRLQRSQNEIARVARDLFRMKAEIMHRHFSLEMLGEMTGMQITPDMEELIRGGMRQYAIDIETDSTVRGDQTKYQGELNAFLQGTAQFGQAIAGLAPLMPQLIAPMTKVYGGFARKFNLGKQGEDALDELTEAGQQPPQQPDDGSEMQKAQMEAEMQARQEDMQMKREEMAAKQQETAQKADLEMRKMDREDQRAALEVQIKQLEIQLKTLDIEAKQAEIGMKREQAHMDMQAKAMDVSHKARMADMEASERDDLHTKEMERIERESAHEQRMEGMKGEAAEADMARKAQAHEQAMELKKQKNGATRTDD